MYIYLRLNKLIDRSGQVILMTTSKKRAKNWCITSFNDPIKWDENIMEFLTYQKEKCPSTGKEHFQTYVQMKKKTYFTEMKKLFGDVHMEIAKGSPDENVAYCNKSDSRIEEGKTFGVLHKQGERNDLNEAYSLAKEGKFQNIEASTAIKYSRGLKWVYELYCKPVRRDNLKVIVFIGEPGSGKSYLAHRLYPNAYVKPSGAWFDGYMNEKEVIMDEFNCEKTDVDDFLQWIDIYPLRVPIKGGFTAWNPEIIVITKLYKPETWFPSRSSEVLRRISICLTINKDNRDEIYKNWKI